MVDCEQSLFFFRSIRVSRVLLDGLQKKERLLVVYNMATTALACGAGQDDHSSEEENARRVSLYATLTGDLVSDSEQAIDFKYACPGGGLS